MTTLASQVLPAVMARFDRLLQTARQREADRHHDDHRGRGTADVDVGCAVGDAALSRLVVSSRRRALRLDVIGAVRDHRDHRRECQKTIEFMEVVHISSSDDVPFLTSFHVESVTVGE